MTNAETEHVAIQYVMNLERAAGRVPSDVRRARLPYDVSSPPRKIEVKAYGRSARGQAMPLEASQVAAARDDPENFYVYVVDNVLDGAPAMATRVIHGAALEAMLARTAPHITYWPTLRAAEYDSAEGLP